MSIATALEDLIESGIHRIGEIEIQTNVSGFRFILSHHTDAALAREPDFGGLECHDGPAAARSLSVHGSDGAYRFVKAQLNLRGGWVMRLASPEELRLALDHFYPASVGVDLARRAGTLDVQDLRDKLNRQTGMYRFARTISDEGAQNLIEQVCGPAHNCARRILWRIDPQTPLADNEASRFNGMLPGLDESRAIPLLCREACNHFVAECRKAAKAEFEAKQATAPAKD